MLFLSVVFPPLAYLTAGNLWRVEHFHSTAFAELNFEFPLFCCSHRCLLQKFQVNTSYTQRREKWIEDNEFKSIFIAKIWKLWEADKKFTDISKKIWRLQDLSQKKLNFQFSLTLYVTWYNHGQNFLWFTCKQKLFDINEKSLSNNLKDFKTRKLYGENCRLQSTDWLAKD